MMQEMNLEMVGRGRKVIRRGNVVAVFLPMIQVMIVVEGVVWMWMVM